MVYMKQLPPVRQLLSLAQGIIFPIERNELVHLAKEQGAPASVIDFLKLFPVEEIFNSRTAFMTRCEEMELLISHKQVAVIEVKRSLQTLRGEEEIEYGPITS